MKDNDASKLELLDEIAGEEGEGRVAGNGLAH